MRLPHQVQKGPRPWSPQRGQPGPGAGRAAVGSQGPQRRGRRPHRPPWEPWFAVSNSPTGTRGKWCLGAPPFIRTACAPGEHPFLTGSSQTRGVAPFYANESVAQEKRRSSKRCLLHTQQRVAVDFRSPGASGTLCAFHKWVLQKHPRHVTVPLPMLLCQRERNRRWMLSNLHGQRTRRSVSSASSFIDARSAGASDKLSKLSHAWLSEGQAPGAWGHPGPSQLWPREVTFALPWDRILQVLHFRK